MISRWWEIKVTLPPVSSEQRELAEETIYWRLQTFGCQGMATEYQVSRGLTIRAYLPHHQASLLDISALGVWVQQDVMGLHQARPRLQWQLMDEEDWAHSWQQYWHPQEIGEKFLVCPAWLTTPPLHERFLILLDPGMAFGTGTHQTTQLCLEALEMQLDDTFEPLGQLTLADIGCGSGILSVAALLLGAEFVYAVDLDPLAVQASQENFALNHLKPEQWSVTEGSIETIPQPVDGLICNILADVIISLVPRLNAVTKPGAWGIFSGLLLSQAPDVTTALEEIGWTVSSVWRRDDWCCLNALRSTEVG
ncbi:50S ribosomal protein L11 methyltransferase [Synechococcus sp. PCC 6312]|uniref:50S ribosomal protein L11 methyltransferase n=1 Tax=Synechococcus sp. (strain ATCC 27167 / PCC 6312) TaxID=195253 RepID=UPI00029F0186|nr:50S ribosomal protein L11 methyltransferase [Synechococcus sp. PCC 6312]AFY61787.1 (LSU ribosomal protein L11P)-lysine N-methyltransferase [Synechococcus sp. PCC 6312]